MSYSDVIVHCFSVKVEDAGKVEESRQPVSTAEVDFHYDKINHLFIHLSINQMCIVMELKYIKLHKSSLIT